MGAVPALEASSARADGARFWAGVVLSLGALAVLVSLGIWQVERLRWKEGVIATIEARIHAAPASLTAVENRQAGGQDIDYVPVTVTGRFLHAGERAFLSTREGQSGWNIYTPLILADGRTAVFVNRGFVPYALKDSARRPAGEVEGTVTVSGLARSAPAAKPGSFVPDNEPARNEFFWRSLPDMAAGLSLPLGVKLLPFFVDAGPAVAPGGWPVGGTTVIDIPNDHLQYAITWFGLAAALASMLAIVIVRRGRDRRNA